MASSKVAIANGALQKLGARRIESLTQDHPNARTMSAAFDGARDSLLRSFDWSFAIKRASIAADAIGPTWGDWSRYTIPNDYLRLLRNDETGYQVDWKIEGLFILSRDASPLKIRYIARIEDVNYYDALFTEALELRLAGDTCEEITQSASKAEMIGRQYDRVIQEARLNGAIEKGAQDFPEDEWLTARY